MKKRTVILCELCEEDRLAATLVHWGLCGEHVEKIGSGVVVLDGALPRGGRAQRQPSIQANKGRGRRGYTKRRHAKCGQMIDPRGWKQHVAACKGQGVSRQVRGRRKRKAAAV